MDWSLTRPEQGNVIGQSDDFIEEQVKRNVCLLYTSPSPRD